MPFISSPEARTLTRLQEGVLGAIDDEFTQHLGAAATEQYIEVVEGLFVPNRRLGRYVLSAADAASERIPVLLRPKSRIDGSSASQTPDQQHRTMRFLDSDACDDLSRGDLMDLRGKVRGFREQKNRVISVSNDTLGICSPVVSRLNLGVEKGMFDVYGRPVIAMRTNKAGEPLLTLAHEASHALEWLIDPILRLHPDEVAFIELDSELRAYTFQAQIERSIGLSTQSADFVTDARRQFEDPARPFRSTQPMLDHFASNEQTHLFSVAAAG